MDILKCQSLEVGKRWNW